MTPSDIKAIINNGWYNELENARNAILNNPKIDLSGALLRSVTEKLDMANPKDCLHIKEIFTKFSTPGLMPKIDKPQTRCNVWHQVQGDYPTFFSWLQHLYTGLQDIKVVYDQSYLSVKQFATRAIQKNIDDMANNNEIGPGELIKRINKLEQLVAADEKSISELVEINKKVMDIIQKLADSLNKK